MHENIRMFVERDYEEMSRKAAEVVAQAMRSKPEGVFGFATGGTPVGLYAELADMHKRGQLDCSGLTTFNLDEYHPISRDDPNSYYYFMFENLFNHINVDPANVHLPDGAAADVDLECRMYEGMIKDAGGIDLQILGIGANGHIGFNEPADSFSARTQYISLSEMTVNSNARFFEKEGDVPRHALTMGIRTIMMSRSIVLVCNGGAKAGVLADALCGPITPLLPASVLQLHPCVTVVADGEAAKYLT